MLDRPADPEAAGRVPKRDSRLPAARPPFGTSRDSLSGFVATVRQRRATLLAVILLVPFFGWLTMQQITPLYTATGSLI